uniref:50S ribosomal protein L9, chloroplastic n=1 Tax=Dicranema revolutum TaxID=239144 RepID=A0A4D6WS51_9FLOR|nr:ribosomal protein L9 [Dicranema revolutum]
MPKKTLIILKETRENIGNKRDIVKVNAGYAFNYLIPQNIAELATPGKLKHLKMFETIKFQQVETLKTKAQITSSHLKNMRKLIIGKQSKHKKQIFGRVQIKEIVDKILQYTGSQLDKKQFDTSVITKTGIYNISIHIFKNIKISFKLYVIKETILTCF